MLPFADAVLVSPAVLAAALEVLAVDQAAVDVVVAERDGADFLKVKVEQVAVDLQARIGTGRGQRLRASSSGK